MTCEALVIIQHKDRPINLCSGDYWRSLSGENVDSALFPQFQNSGFSTGITDSEEKLQ